MSRDILADAARKHAHMLPGHILLAAEPAALPASTLTLDLLVEHAEELDAAQKYALRAMMNGIDTPDDLQLFLGLDHSDTARAIAGLLEAEYIDYRPPKPGHARRLTLLDTGREAARDAQLRRPKPASIQVVYDRLTGRLTGWRKQALSRAAVAKADEGRILLPPASSRHIELEDLTVGQLTEALQLRRETVRVLGIAGVTENRHYYYNAILLVYKDIDSNTLRLGVDIDGEWSEAHDIALDSIGAVDRLGLSAAPADSPYEPVPDPDATGIRLSREEVIAIQKAFTEEEAEADSAALDRAQIRWLGVYEHPQWLDDALSNSKRRLLIISPWITRSVVTAQWVRRLEQLSRTADVTIFWGFGDNEKTDINALKDLHEAATRSTRLAIVKVEDTHAKVLVSDTYYIKTSFNWLSFRGDRSKRYRQEEGDLVQDRELADRQYDRYMTENCGRALEVVGTLPERYRPLVEAGGTTGRGASTVHPTASAGQSATGALAASRARGARKERGNPRKSTTPAGSRDEIRRAALRKIAVGQTMSGVVKSIAVFGAFVNLGHDVTGLIHISQLATRRVGHPTEVVNVDDNVIVTVLNVDVEAGRVSLKLTRRI
ncbi:S1 RNA-binding domain-containing protein [Mycobacterium sp. TY815]|uniref:S1 RNA-binding domain-containing protein n=1 Tax=Mycobacterium sp. TY815 TaxID=3050581 RepID=UPI002740E052|nr:S1 RNA-binding domain-containing protein [Mycobacterium sp. TY815]MDP7707438.1 S1 RNA-binding domain-containing protein [Mycobacterium sp. TY815]